MKRRDNDAEDQAGLCGQRNDGTDQNLSGEQPGQRERERERRVSDADASYNRPIRDTRTLNNAIPQRNHAKNNSLSEATRSLSQGPCFTGKKSTTEANPKPDLISTPPSCRGTSPQAGMTGHGSFIPDLCAVVKPLRQRCRPFARRNACSASSLDPDNWSRCPARRARQARRPYARMPACIRAGGARP